ncbi:MAG: PD-(D/E)XK nuclease family protein [candidate division WOR-3 bacterium]|nr:PD-(D/E)XK nuclease family protein [candidate division WOR-3 bacterium]
MRFLRQVYNKAMEYDTKNTAVIMPSQRACVYLREQFKHSEKTMILPDIMTMEQFAENMSGLKQEDNLNLALWAYKVFSKHISGRDFEEFLKIFNIMMTDFNDIDMYGVGIDRLNNLAEIAELEYREGGFAEKYFSMMAVLKDIYSELNQLLDKRQTGYRGMIYKKALSSIENNDLPQNIIFSGFNILTPVEQQIIDALIKKTNVDLLFNIPDTLLSSNHEAAYFINSHLEKWPDNAVNFDCSDNQEVKIYEYSLPTDQVKVFDREARDKETAVVLCDESMMIPAVKGLPEEIKNINITMGYPLKMTTVFMLYKAIMQLHANRTPQGYYRDDILNLIENKYAKKKLSGRLNVVRSRMRENMTSYIELNKIFGGFEENQFIQDVFDWYDDDSIKGSQYILKKLIDLMESIGAEESKVVPAESNIVTMINTFNRILTLFENNSDILNYDNPGKLDSLISNVIAGASVPFSGDPLTDFQIMGMLETRCLDYERTIIMSVNEGIIPKGKRSNSFIPFDVRRGWGLPTYMDSDKLFSYYFYTLLLNSNETVITFAKSDDENYSERSRFIEQLLWEIREGGLFEGLIDKESPIIEDSVDVDNTRGLKIIDKTDDIIEKMKSRSFSPSSISQYIRNPVDYYFNYVLGITDDNDIDAVGYREIGTAAHDALEKIMAGQVGETYNGSKVNMDKQYIEKLIEESFKNNNINDSSRGKPYVMKRAIREMMIKFLEEDKKRSHDKIKIMELEEGKAASITVNDMEISLYGRFDRIEEKDSNIIIMDYKSGNVNNSDLSVSKIEDPKTDNVIDIDEWKDKLNDDKKFQLLLYGYIACRQGNWQDRAFNLGIYSLRTPGEVYYLHYPRKKKPLVYEKGSKLDRAFERVLRDIISEMLDKDISFEYVERGEWG